MPNKITFAKKLGNIIFEIIFEVLKLHEKSYFDYQKVINYCSQRHDSAVLKIFPF